MNTYTLTLWAIWLRPTHSSEVVRHATGTLEQCLVLGARMAESFYGDGVAAVAWQCARELWA